MKLSLEEFVDSLTKPLPVLENKSVVECLVSKTIDAKEVHSLYGKMYDYPLYVVNDNPEDKGCYNCKNMILDIVVKQVKLLKRTQTVLHVERDVTIKAFGSQNETF